MDIKWYAKVLSYASLRGFVQESHIICPSSCCISTFCDIQSTQGSGRQGSASKRKAMQEITPKRVLLALQEDRSTYSEGSVSTSRLRVKQNGVEQRSCIMQDVSWEGHAVYGISILSTVYLLRTLEIEHPFFARFSLSSCRKTPDCIMRR